MVSMKNGFCSLTLAVHGNDPGLKLFWKIRVLLERLRSLPTNILCLPLTRYLRFFAWFRLIKEPCAKTENPNSNNMFVFLLCTYVCSEMINQAATGISQNPKMLLIICNWFIIEPLFVFMSFKCSVLLRRGSSFLVLHNVTWWCSLKNTIFIKADKATITIRSHSCEKGSWHYRVSTQVRKLWNHD